MPINTSDFKRLHMQLCHLIMLHPRSHLFAGVKYRYNLQFFTASQVTANRRGWPTHRFKRTRGKGRVDLIAATVVVADLVQFVDDPRVMFPESTLQYDERLTV